MNLDHIKGPTLILDEHKLLRNIEKMSRKAKEAGITFRPHFKTHQSKAIGHIFKRFEIHQITVSSIAMAEYFAEDGWEDICIAVPVNIREIERLTKLSQIPYLHLVIESIEAIQALSSLPWINPPSLYIKVDAGYGRTGIEASDAEQIQGLINKIHKSTFAFSGLLVHMGNSYDANSKNQIEQIWQDSTNDINALRDKLQNGHDIFISMGDTPTCSVLDNFVGYDEIRPGNFVFYDLTQAHIGSCTYDDIAVCLACPVIAIHPLKSTCIVHAGGIHLSKDRLQLDDELIYGKPVFFNSNSWEFIENAVVSKLSQEHGTIRLPMDVINKLKIGTLIGIVPVHSCMTANLMAVYHTLDGKQYDHLNSLPPIRRF